jgi:hypothetical protein
VKISVPSKQLSFTDRWDETCDQAFRELKELMVCSPILGYPDFTLPFILETDASVKGMGAVLSQEQETGKVVIAYGSRSLKPSERNMENYSAMKLELLALKWAIADKFRDYLLGAKFTVFTDNNPLCYLETSKLGATEMRWVSQLSQFDFDIKYRSGKHNQNADALSRRYSCVVESVDAHVILETVTDSSFIPCDLRSAIEEELILNVKIEEIKSTDLTTSSTLPVIPQDQLAKLQLEDTVISRVLHYWNQNRRPIGRQLLRESKTVRKLIRSWPKFKLIGGVLHRII